MRIGLTGYATSGKDEVADVLATEYGFVKVNMSDAINNYLCILNPIISIQHFPALRYAEYVAEHGYVQAKEHPEVRRLLQTFGTDVGRAIDLDMWVKEAAKLASLHERVVTTGIRYVNEAVPGMMVVRVNRPGFGPLNDHTSESLADVFALAEITIENDGTLEELRAKTRRFAEYFVHHRDVSFVPEDLMQRYGKFTALDGTTPFMEGFTEGRGSPVAAWAADIEASPGGGHFTPDDHAEITATIRAHRDGLDRP